MKKILRTAFTFLFFLATAQLIAQTNEPKKERKKYENFKERNLSKTYPASGNKLNIENRFGIVKVTTWDKNEIKVDIHIEASSTDKELADKTFDRIDIKESQEGKNITLKTV